MLLILVIFSCMGLFFARNYYSGLFHHLYTGLPNDGRINDGYMTVRSLSHPQCGERLIRDSDRPVNTGFVTLAPCTDIGFEARPHLFGCIGDFGIAERAQPHRVFDTRAIFPAACQRMPHRALGPPCESRLCPARAQHRHWRRSQDTSL